MKDPIVIEPAGFDAAAAWRECHDYSDRMHDAGRPIAAAHGADPGIVSCPACGTMFWAWGSKQRCTDCAFEFPVHWWSKVAAGRDDRGSSPLPFAAPDHPADPWYMLGWLNTDADHEFVKRIDIRAYLRDFQPYVLSQAEAELIAKAPTGDCRHWRGIREGTCEAGVNLRQLAGGPELGCMTRLPCLRSLYRRANGPIVKCDRFELKVPRKNAAAQ